MSWSLRFAAPIRLPTGKSLATLRDAGDHIQKLPKTEHQSKEWQVAMHCLIQAADHGGPVLFARIGIMQALNRHVARVFDPSHGDAHWGRRKLKRDAP